MANSVDPDQTPYSAASDLGLHFAKAYPSQYFWLLWYLAEHLQKLDGFQTHPDIE